jgi:hypothetical protein
MAAAAATTAITAIRRRVVALGRGFSALLELGFVNVPKDKIAPFRSINRRRMGGDRSRNPNT